MFCLLCRNHGAVNRANNSKVFNEEPSVRYKRSALVGTDGHVFTKTHKQCYASHKTKTTSTFAAQVKEQKETKDTVLTNSFHAAYYLAKQEIANTKLLSLIDLFCKIGKTEMKHFKNRSQRSQRDMFFLLGEKVKTKLKDKLKDKPYGLLLDDVSDISILELMIIFVQYYDDDDNEVKVDFLGTQNILEDEESADAGALLRVLLKELADSNLDILKAAGLNTDGASVMTGKNNGLSAKVKHLNPLLVAIHCICHRLALACSDASKEVKPVAILETTLHQLWKFLDDSPKRTATYVKVCESLKVIKPASKAVKKKAGKKIKKACKARWLSNDLAVQSVDRNIEPLLCTLRHYKEAGDATATGLLRKMATAKFVGTIYILKAVLPLTAGLNKVFQKGNISFANISPAIDSTKEKLTQLRESGQPIIDFKADLEGRLENLELKLTKAKEKELSNLLEKYIDALIENIDDRFAGSLPILNAFKIFDPCAMPKKDSVEFLSYGVNEISTIADHYYADSQQKQQQLKDEWSTFKYRIEDWNSQLPKNVKNPQPGKLDVQSPTQWLLLRAMKEKPSLKLVFPLMLEICETVLVLPVSNAWPERGASAVKRLKTRLRNRLLLRMLNALLQIVINGPSSAECDDLIAECAKEWRETHQRNLPPLLSQAQVSEPEPEAAELVDVGIQASVQEEDKAIEKEAAEIVKIIGFDEDSDSYDSAFESDDSDFEDE